MKHELFPQWGAFLLHALIGLVAWGVTFWLGWRVCVSLAGE